MLHPRPVAASNSLPADGDGRGPPRPFQPARPTARLRRPLRRRYSPWEARRALARHSPEQYTRGRPGPAPASNSLEHARHLWTCGVAVPVPVPAAPAVPAFSALLPGDGRLSGLGPRAYPLFRHGSEQYRTVRLDVANSLPHSLQRTRDSTLRRAVPARTRAAWTARLSGSARYLRMYSRRRARACPARQSSEQNARRILPPGPAPRSNALPHSRHLWACAALAAAALAAAAAADGALAFAPPAPRPRAAAAAKAAAAALLRAPLLSLRALTALRHGSEQYRTVRLDAENARPHSPHRTRRARPTSLSVRSLHLGQ